MGKTRNNTSYFFRSAEISGCIINCEHLRAGGTAEVAFAIKVELSFRGQIKMLAKTTSQGGIFFTGQPHSKEKLEEYFRARKGRVGRVEEWLEWLEGPTLQLRQMAVLTVMAQ